MTEKRRPQPDETPSGTRKEYGKPRLEEFGHVTKLTQSGGSTANEPGNPMSKKCL